MNKKISLGTLLLVALALLGGGLPAASAAAAMAVATSAHAAADMVVTAPRIRPGDMVVTAPRLTTPDPELLISIEAGVQRAVALATGRSAGGQTQREIRLAAAYVIERG
jgi:hypothetical protein